MLLSLPSPRKSIVLRSYSVHTPFICSLVAAYWTPIVSSSIAVADPEVVLLGLLAESQCPIPKAKSKCGVRPDWEIL